jgi:hypothetical protein
MKERREIEDQILKCEIDFNDEVEMKLTDNNSNAWRSHCETTGLPLWLAYPVLLGSVTSL